MLTGLQLDKIFKLKDETPLNKDCGLLCNCACCDSSKCEEKGMLLFPGEEAIYANDNNFVIDDTEFVLSDGYVVKLVVCNGKCDRNKRPISCRIFPLIAFVFGDEFDLALDIRGMNICPLVLPEVSDYIQDEFYDYVENVYNILFEDSHSKELIELLSEEIKKFA